MSASTRRVVLPGECIGLVGGGQLGRMFILAARRMGYEVAVLTPHKDDPAAQIASSVIIADYSNLAAYQQLAEQSRVVTYEFEGVSAEALSAIEKQVPVYPQPQILAQLRNRALEKTLLERHDFPVGRFAVANTVDELTRGLEKVGLPAVVKTATAGYDGKGQRKVESPVAAETIWQQLGEVQCTIEEWIDLKLEISVIVARDQFGGIATYGPFGNQHSNHILDIASFPAQLKAELSDSACKLAHRFVEEFNLVGVICLEFFVDKNGRLLVNEIAPRPHNSGHLTIEAFSISQFEQQVRTVCGLPVGEVKSICPAAMANLLGDLWQNGTPDWTAALADKGVCLHLYGKHNPSTGRKMGHLTVLDEHVERAISRVRKARSLI